MYCFILDMSLNLHMCSSTHWNGLFNRLSANTLFRCSITGRILYDLSVLSPLSSLEKCRFYKMDWSLVLVMTFWIFSKLQPFCLVYLFVSVTIISRSSFIPVTVWNMSKIVEPWSRSTSISVAKIHSFFAIGFSLSSHFYSSVVLFFSSLFCLCLVGHCPFSVLCCSRRIEHWPFSFFNKQVTDLQKVEWQQQVTDWKYIEWQKQNSVHLDLKYRFHPCFR